MWPNKKVKKPSPKADPTSLGNLLVNINVITQEQLDKAIEFQASNGELLLGEVCVYMGFIERELLSDIVDQQRILRSNTEDKHAAVIQRVIEATTKASGLNQSLDSLMGTVTAALRKAH